MRVPVDPHLLQYLILIITIESIKRYLIGVLVCMSLKTSEAEQLFIYLLDLWIVSFMKCLGWGFSVVVF